MCVPCPGCGTWSAGVPFARIGSPGTPANPAWTPKGLPATAAAIEGAAYSGKGRGEQLPGGGGPDPPTATTTLVLILRKIPRRGNPWESFVVLPMTANVS